MFIMKLIIAIVQDEDSSKLLSKLMQIGLSATKLATTGGFLKAGNTTLLLGVEEERIQDALKIIESVCKSRKQISTAPSALVGGMTHGEYSSFPIEVTVGGKQLTLSGKVGAAGSFSGEWTAGKAVDIVYGKVGDAPAVSMKNITGPRDAAFRAKTSTLSFSSALTVMVSTS